MSTASSAKPRTIATVLANINRNRSVFIQSIVYISLAGLTLLNIVSGNVPTAPVSDSLVPTYNHKVIKTHERIQIKGGSFVETSTVETLHTQVEE